MLNFPRTRVKICGITRPADGLAAAMAGADAIGLVFYDRSPRAVTISQAQSIAAALPPFVTKVGLFVNADEVKVKAVLAKVPLDLLQFHGDEDPRFCASFDKPYLKALRMKPGLALEDGLAAYGSAQGILLDAWHEQHYGGTGLAFDWTRTNELKGNARLVLAGGLHPGNVAAAIRQVRPWAVDVSSGVESAPGIKSEKLVQQFISEVQRV